LHLIKDNRLLWLDLDKDFEWANDTRMQSAPKPSNIPSLITGAAFVPKLSSSKFYIFGGEYNAANKTSNHSQVPPSDGGGMLFSFNRDDGEWRMEETSGDQPQQVDLGLWTDDTNAGVSYYLGGAYSKYTTSSLSTDYLVVNGLLVLNYTDMSWRNETVPGDPTIRGFLHYLPIGESGILVKFGGERFTANKYNSASTLVCA